MSSGEKLTAMAEQEWLDGEPTKTADRIHDHFCNKSDAVFSTRRPNKLKTQRYTNTNSSVKSTGETVRPTDRGELMEKLMAEVTRQFLTGLAVNGPPVELEIKLRMGPVSDPGDHPPATSDASARVQPVVEVFDPLYNNSKRETSKESGSWFENHFAKETGLEPSPVDEPVLGSLMASSEMTKMEVAEECSCSDKEASSPVNDSVRCDVRPIEFVNAHLFDIANSPQYVPRSAVEAVNPELRLSSTYTPIATDPSPPARDGDELYETVSDVATDCLAFVPHSTISDLQADCESSSSTSVLFSACSNKTCDCCRQSH